MTNLGVKEAKPLEAVQFQYSDLRGPHKHHHQVNLAWIRVQKVFPQLSIILKIWQDNITNISVCFLHVRVGKGRSCSTPPSMHWIQS